MGKITKKIAEVHAIERNEDLIKRFKKVIAAQAIREYLGTKIDNMLVFEVKMLSEEISVRMGKNNPIYSSEK